MPDELNGEATPQAPGPINNRINHQLVTLLRNALRDAEAGRIIAGSVIAVLDPGVVIPFIALRGSFQGSCEIICGAELVKSHVINKGSQPQQPAIMRAGNMPRQ